MYFSYAPGDQTQPKTWSGRLFQARCRVNKLKLYPSADKPLRKAVELSPDNETANDTLAENLFQISKSVRANGKTGEEIDVLRKVVYFNPEHIPAHERLSDA